MIKKLAKRSWLLIWATVGILATISGAIAFFQIILEPQITNIAARERFSRLLQISEIYHNATLSSLAPNLLVGEWKRIVEQTLRIEGTPGVLPHDRYDKLNVVNEKQSEIAKRLENRISLIETLLSDPVDCVRLNECNVDHDSSYCKDLRHLLDSFQYFDLHLGSFQVTDVQRLATRPNSQKLAELCMLDNPSYEDVALYVQKLFDNTIEFADDGRLDHGEIDLLNGIVSMIPKVGFEFSSQFDIQQMRAAVSQLLIDLSKRLERYCAQLDEFIVNGTVDENLGVSGGEFRCSQNESDMICHTHTNAGYNTASVIQLFRNIDHLQSYRNPIPVFGRCPQNIDYLSKSNFSSPKFVSWITGECENLDSFVFRNATIYFYDCKLTSVFRVRREP